MTTANTGGNKRVIALLDIDAFECQIWQRFYPSQELWGSPCVVTDKTGRITSATYEAKGIGISRDIRLGEARKIAKEANMELTVFEKPNDREKPDCKTTRYASWEIVDALKEYCAHYAYGVKLEYASSDEFFLDITEEVQIRLQNKEAFSNVVESNVFLESDLEMFTGADLKKRIASVYNNNNVQSKSPRVQNEERLLYGALLMQEIMNFVFSKTKFISSTGVGNNKLMAKLAVSLHRPNGITVLSEGGLKRMGKMIPLEKIPGLGGKTGMQIKTKFQIRTIEELAKIHRMNLDEEFGKEKASEIYHLCRGLVDDPVKEKLYYDAVNCAKNFYGQIKSEECLLFHLHCLVEEIFERLEEERTRHYRTPTTLRCVMEYMDNEANKEKFTSNMDESHYLGKSAGDMSNYIIQDILRKFKNMAAINIIRICVTAKGFAEIPKVPETPQMN